MKWEKHPTSSESFSSESFEAFEAEQKFLTKKIET